MSVIRIYDEEELIATKEFKYASWPFEFFNPVQSAILKHVSNDTNIAIAAATSAGKAQPDDTLVLTPKGYVQLGTLKVGDYVIGVDGKPTKILGIFPQGEKKVVDICFNDKSKTTCCFEHLWNVRTRSQKKRNLGFNTIQLSEIINSFEVDKYHIPLVDPIEFKAGYQLDIHPYILGLLIGDGGMKYGLKISNHSVDILKRFSLFLPETMNLEPESRGDYRITCNQSNFNPLINELNKMSLIGKGASEKFIPWTYLHSSIPDRIELLKGLMDSDGGGYSNKSPTFEITSKELAYNVEYLVRSLGGWTHIRIKSCSKYTYKGEIRYGLPVYRLTICLPFNPFGAGQKYSQWTARKRQKLRTIKAIENERVSPCRCIKVANQDGLYVTNDFIVTHNTVMGEMYMSDEIRRRKGKALYVGPLKALAKEKQEDWTDKKHHFNDLNISICTGDFRLTGARIKELDKSDVIVMTPEMLASRCRNQKSEKSNFLKEVGTIVFDECFTEDALVLTEIGYIPIGVIIDRKMNVKVASYNHESCTIEYKKIIAFQKKSLRKIWHSIVYNGGNIIVTENQAIWVENKGYVAAKNVCVGDILLVGEHDGKNKKLDSSYSNREEYDLRNSTWRRVDSSVWNEQIGTIESQAMLETKRISRVEVREVKKIGWKPSDSIRKWRVRKQDIQFLDTIISRTKRNLRSGYNKRQENCDTKMVGSNRSSDCFGSLVYGRWQSSEEFNETSHRVISGRGSSIACRLADGVGHHRMPSISNEELFRVALHSQRKRSISRNCALSYNSEYEIQITSKDGRNFLFNVWNQIYGNKETHIRGQKSSALFRDLHEEVEEYVRKIEEIPSEESICCDLEIEDNNNFFVMQPESDVPVLCHNSHLLTVPSRGDHIEVALMKMMNINPNVRIVFLSATMPNVDEICDWISSITKRDTVLIESEYRPCPLKIHYETYPDYGRYEEKESSKVGMAAGIVNHYGDDKFLVFVHTKNTGKLMVDTLNNLGIEAEFHNADLSADKRGKLENAFKNDPKCRVIVATSTLAWGLNLPARRVVIVGVHRGLSNVENYDIRQMIGRAGRPKYDPRGDAYILIPDSRSNEWLIRLQKATPIRSQLLEDAGGHHKTLAFHIVSEIHHKNIQTKEGLYKWFSKSLAHFQDQRFDDHVIDKVIKLLENTKCITTEKGVYKTTPVGNIASMFYFSPFDVSDLRRNLHFLFDKNQQGNDLSVAMALGNLDSNRLNIVNKAEKMEIDSFQRRIEGKFGAGRFTEGAIKAGCAYYKMMNGEPVKSLATTQSSIRLDLDRTMEVVNALDQMSSKWNQKEFFSTLRQRILYGVKPELLDLVSLPGVGKVRAERLHAAGLSIEKINKMSDDALAGVLKIKDIKAIQKLKQDAKLANLRKML